MRKIIYLDQDGIDAMVQLPDAYKKAGYNNMRALQDGLIDEVTFPDMIIRRKDKDTRINPEDAGYYCKDCGGWRLISKGYCQHVKMMKRT